ncbi:MAG TPA: hypothetical protein VGS10_15260 [Terracidiphilus sp.]|nr:hypothetical protein [Terracidiphilus sp.]
MKCEAVLSLSIATACLVFLGANYAEARGVTSPARSTTVTTPYAGHREALKMVPAQADLTKPINARNMRAGQQFEARLSQTIHLKNGPELRRGTELFGKVVADKLSNDGKTSSLALRFAHAELKGGKIIPIKATIVGIYPSNGSYWSSYNNSQMPNYWTSNTLKVDQINALNGVDLHSNIAARNSGVLVSKKGNMKLADGSEFALAIAGRRTSDKKTNMSSTSGVASKRGT